MSLPSAPLRVALIGAGTVGTATAHLLSRRGHRTVGVASRSASSARRAADLLGSSVFTLDDGLPEADLVLLGTPEAALEELVSTMVPKLSPGRVIAHFAGVVGIDPLGRAADVGAHTLALHPVQACPDVPTALARLPGSAWGITSAPEIAEWADGLVREDLEGTPVRVSEEARPLWHAAAALTANGLTALLAVAEEMLLTAGVTETNEVLAPLASGVVANAVERGAGESLTGPIVRGDTATIAAHVRALRNAGPLLEGYLYAARLTLSAALLAGRLAPGTQRALSEVLEGA
ncbi:MAG: Rossmann-like and DUF2520 domain-containing protein [Actinomycetota bacterium]